MKLERIHELENRLRGERPQPPVGLAERLKREIPEPPRVVDAAERFAARRTAGAPRWAIAATIAVALVGGGLTLRTWRLEAPESPAEVWHESTFLDGVPESDPALDTREAPALSEEGASAAAERRQEPRSTPRQSPTHPAPEPPQRQALREQRAADPARGSEGQPARGELFLADAVPASPDRVRPYAPKSPLAYSREALQLAVPQGPPPSTGGTAEPNDQPYGDMFFRGHGVNPFVDTEDDSLSTFGLDVDTGSYTLARSYLDRGHLPPPESVRVEEFINFFDYRDAAPSRDDFAVRAEAAPSPFTESDRYRLLRFNVHAREIAAEDRLPATLIFVVDVSGSMAREDRLGLVRRSLQLLLDQLRPDDRVGLVVYGSRGRVLLEPTEDLQAIRDAIERLRAEGSTNAEEGLVLAYELADRYARQGTILRIVLCSDGVANVGRTGPESILERIGAATESGVELSTVGFGMGNFNDHLMEQLADRGDGSYAYVDSLSEARRIFTQNLTGMLQTVAGEAKVQVEFDPSVVSRYRLLGYENRAIADERFRDDTVDAGEIGAGHSVTALYEVKLADSARPRETLATLRLRFESRAAGEVVELERSIRVREIAADWEAASPSLRLSSVVAEFAEILRGSYWAQDGDLSDLFIRAQRVAAEFPGDVDVAELVGTIGRAAQLADAALSRSED